MENVLREVRQEIMIGEREREKLRKQGDDAEKRAEEQEVKILELQTMLESSRRQNSVSPSKGSGSLAPTGLAAEIDSAVKDATERVARELHSLYKSKHETKVEALKKSYAARWEKQVRELQESLKSAKDEIVKMQTERDATMSGVVPGQAQMLEGLQREKEEMQAEKSMLHARIKGLEEESSTMRAENEDLRQNLDKERAEKGELVAQVDLFLSIEADMGSKASTAGEEKPIEAPSPSKELRTSLSGGRPRPISMLKPPGKFTGTGIPGPGKTPIGRGIPRGGIMEGIARMGAGGRG
jgi:chromosome segregation ATPase